MEAVYDSGLRLILRYIRKIFPEVDRQMAKWTDLSKNTEDSVLGAQALASLSLKRFHAQGGSVYALYPKVDLSSSLRFIVSFQTISDYLDNLCDRAGVYNEEAFRQLHLSMLDAVSPHRNISDYYLYYPYKKDSSYLTKLVEECRAQIVKLPSYNLVAGDIASYVKYYTELQVLKHLKTGTRENRLLSWAKQYQGKYPSVSCWEFSAASGSTLGIFMLFAAASDPSLKKDEVDAINAAYFPWISGLHILLDYYIDAQEDLQAGDLNFTYYYKNLKQCEERITYFVEKSLDRCMNLSYPKFHVTVIKGLLALYLSDPKALSGFNRLTSRNILKKSGRDTVMYYNMCRVLRSTGVL